MNHIIFPLLFIYFSCIINLQRQNPIGAILLHHDNRNLFPFLLPSSPSSTHYQRSNNTIASKTNKIKKRPTKSKVKEAADEHGKIEDSNQLFVLSRHLDGARDSSSDLIASGDTDYSNNLVNKTSQERQQIMTQEDQLRNSDEGSSQNSHRSPIRQIVI